MTFKVKLPASRAKIWSYLDAVIAITGAGSTVFSAFCNKADDSITSVLKSIVGHARCVWLDKDKSFCDLTVSVMWSLMLLCTTSESFPAELRRSERLQAALSATEIRDQPPMIDRAGVAVAVKWLSPLVGEWMDRLRQYHNVGDTAALPGAKVALICAHIRGVFREHRKALEDSVDYCRRSRDPGATP